MASQPEESQDRPLIHAAEKAMERTLGGIVKLGENTMRDKRYRSLMLRCPVLEPRADMPGSVIVKGITADEGEPYNPSDTKPFGPPARLFNEWAGARFLNGLDLTPPLSPRFYGGDRELGFVVLEDLGDGECLADLLQGDDASRAESALFAYVTTLGRMHAATIGKEAEFALLRDGLSPRTIQERSRIGDWLTDEIPKFRAACETLGVSLHPGADTDIAAIASAIEEPGPFLAFSPGDTCPDNHRMLNDGMRLFDFEWCEYRHALIDMVYTRVPFPTCWCVNRLPAGLSGRLETAYRTELVTGCPEAADDALFSQALVALCGYWTTRTLAWSLAGALEKDETWGISSLRPRVMLRLDTLVAASEQFGRLPSLAATASALAKKLRSLWPPEAEMPLYPPFRSAV